MREVQGLLLDAAPIEHLLFSLAFCFLEAGLELAGAGFGFFCLFGMLVLMGEGLELLGVLEVADAQLVLLGFLLEGDRVVHLPAAELALVVLAQFLRLALQPPHCALVPFFLGAQLALETEDGLVILFEGGLE